MRSVSTYLGVEMREIFHLQGQMKKGQTELRQEQLEAIRHQMDISAFSARMKGEIADIASAVSSVNGLFGTITSVWSGGLSPIGRIIAALLVMSLVLILTGYLRASVVSACTGGMYPPVLGFEVY